MSRVSSRLWLWHIPALVGCLAALLFATGFWLALSGSIGEPLGSSPPAPAPAASSAKPTGARLLLVLGDSLARGTGDESGRGYAADVLEFLKRRGPAQMANLAVNGAQSPDLRELIQSENVSSLAAAADLILISAGANDLSHALPRGTGSPAAAVEEIGRTRTQLASNLRETLRSLRRANPKAPICLLGLYDPFGEEGPQSRSRIGASVISSWNAVLQETALSFPAVFLVPTFDLFQNRPDRLAVDHFHPNRRGYEAIAARIEQLIPEKP